MRNKFRDAAFGLYVLPAVLPFLIAWLIYRDVDIGEMTSVLVSDDVLRPFMVAAAILWFICVCLLFLHTKKLHKISALDPLRLLASASAAIIVVAYFTWELWVPFIIAIPIVFLARRNERNAN